MTERLASCPGPPEGRTGWPWEAPQGGPADAVEPSGDWPRISVVTATFNQGAYIEETIRSVLLQAYPDVEYIVMDGGSTDETRDILEKYSDHLNFWTSEKDDGAADALRRGFDRATGSILAYLNSDDVYLPGAFHKVARRFRTGKEDLVYGNVYWVDPGGKKLGERRQAPCSRMGFLYGGADILQPASFWTSRVYRQSGGIDPSFSFHFDLDMFYRFAVGGAKFGHIRDFLASFRIHPESKSSTLATTYRQELDRIRSAYLDHRIDSVHGILYRNLGRLERAAGYTLQGDLGWLLGRIPDRIRSRHSPLVVGPRTKWM